MEDSTIRTPEELTRILNRTDAEATAEYVASRNLTPEPGTEYNYSGFGYEEKPPLGWGQ